VTRPLTTERLADRVIVFLLVGGSGLYTIQVGLSPIYAFFTVGFILEIYLWTISPGMNGAAKPLLLIIGLLMASILPIEIFNASNFNILIGFSLSLIIFPLLVNRLDRCKDQHILQGSRFLIWSSIALFVTDAIQRVLHPDFSQILKGSGEENPWLNAYKTNGIMYIDSNFVGLHAAILFGFTCYLAIYYKRSFKLEKWALLLMALLSFSRASLVAIIATYLYANRKSRRLITAYSVIIALAIPLWGLAFLAKDDSFLSKGQIMSEAINYMFRANGLDMVLGAGFNRTVDVLGIGAHSLLVMFFVERGVLGMILIGTLWGILVRRFGEAALFPLIPYWVNGFSLTSHSVPFLYASLAVTIALARRRENIHLPPSPELAGGYRDEAQIA